MLPKCNKCKTRLQLMPDKQGICPNCGAKWKLSKDLEHIEVNVKVFNVLHDVKIMQPPSKEK